MKKNGFTLVELIAVIVIIAIIALIIVPTTQDVIKKSEKGAAKDSAYGYIKSIENWQYGEMQNGKDIYLDGNYLISNGYLSNYKIPLTGKSPTSGYLTYNDDDLASGCLVINGYAVRYQNGEFTATEKGDCDSPAVVLSCSSDEYLYEQYAYNVDNQEMCQTYIKNSWGCDVDDESCLQQVYDYCTGNSENTIYDDINYGYIKYSDIESFVSREVTDSWCRPNAEKCFGFIDNGDETATINNYLCGAEWDYENEEYITDGKILDVIIPSEITLKDKKIQVTIIGTFAFSEKMITSVIIPNSITEIGYGAFYYNRLSKVTIPGSVHTLKDSSFEMNQLTELTLSDGVQRILNQAFQDNLLTEVTIPSSVTFLSGYVFKNNQLVSVILNNTENISSIGNRVFEKSAESNPNLNIIYNNTGQAPDWCSFVGYGSRCYFEQGTIVHPQGNITVTTGYPSNNN